nr:GHKL domain-containing protein [uncultured Clostridium sp.]
MDRQAVLFTAGGMFIDSIVLFFYLNCHSIKEHKRLQAFFAYVSYFVINYILGSTTLPVCTRAVCNLGMIMVIEYFFYDRMNGFQIIKEAIMFILLLGVAELLIMPVIFLLTNHYDADIFNDSSRYDLWLISMGLSRMIAMIFFLLCRKFQNQNYEKLDKREKLNLFSPLTISFISFLLITKIVIDYDGLKKEYFIVILVLIASLLVISAMLHIIFLEKYIHYRDRDQELSMLKQKNSIQYEYYINQKETFHNMRIMYHDLKNHMLLSSLSPDYLTEIKSTLSQFEKFSDSGNGILNILLWKKYSEANKYGIELESVIEKVDLNFMDDMDICSIVGNILDNAIEACKEVDRNRIPEISVRIGKINNFIIIKIENDCIGSLRRKGRGNVFETTKAEKDMHGIGLSSVKRAVEKYDGNCEFECSNHKFTTEILIPIPIIR